jgi:hypothetical protein
MLVKWIYKRIHTDIYFDLFCLAQYGLFVCLFTHFSRFWSCSPTVIFLDTPWGSCVFPQRKSSYKTQTIRAENFVPYSIRIPLTNQWQLRNSLARSPDTVGDILAVICHNTTCVHVRTGESFVWKNKRCLQYPMNAHCKGNDIKPFLFAYPQIYFLFNFVPPKVVGA